MSKSKIKTKLNVRGEIKIMDKKQSMNIVVVKWHDARFYPGTYTKKKCKKHNMCLFESLGYIISKDETTIRIAGERNNEGQYRDITLIPVGTIMSISELIPRTSV